METVVFVELVSVLTLVGAAEVAVMLLPDTELPGDVVTVPEPDTGEVVTVPEEGVVAVPELVFVVTVVVVVVTVVLPLLLVLVELDELVVSGVVIVPEDELWPVPAVACVTVMPPMLLVHTPSLLKLYSVLSMVTVLFLIILPFSLSR